jgi:alkylation response protein AidB-like acyl-CoA dehydrogenase
MNPEQEQFRASLHSLLDASDIPAIARAWASGSYDSGLALWRKLSDLGVTALAIPAEFDGIGATATDLVVAFEELGHHAVPGPAIESVAVLPTLLSLTASSGTAFADATAAASAADGRDATELTAADTAPSPDASLRGTAADTAPNTGTALRGAAADGAPRLGGMALEWLPRLASGDTLATLAWPPHVPFAVDAGVAALPLGGRVVRESVASVDPARQLSSIDGGQFLRAIDTSDEADARVAAFDMGALACAAQLLGCGQALLEQSVQYVQQRVQFGQSIGRFQAVKHHLADVRIALDFARPLVYNAANSLLPQDISAAKVAASEAANLAARHGLQVHGAIGYTLECDLSLWLVKVRALIPAWGTPSWHRSRLMETL